MLLGVKGTPERGVNSWLCRVRARAAASRFYKAGGSRRGRPGSRWRLGCCRLGTCDSRRARRRPGQRGVTFQEPTDLLGEGGGGLHVEGGGRGPDRRTGGPKVFDCMDHDKLWDILKRMRIPDHITCLLRNLYAGQKATELDMEQQTGSK